MNRRVLKVIPIISLFLLSSCSLFNKNEVIEAKGISFSFEEQYLELDDTLKLKPKFTPSNANKKEVTWTSSDKDIATVSEKGVISPVSVGQTTIKAVLTTSEYKVSASCEIKVVDSIVSTQSVRLDTDSVTIERGESTDLVATISPNNATNQGIEWTVNNDNAYVDVYGRVTGLKVGNSVVTAKTKDGEYKATCTVNVTESSLDQWTVLIYMCGADLESSYANQTVISDGYNTYQHNGQGLATMDIMEILEVPNQPNDVNIVIQTGGASEWTTTEYANYGDYDIDPSKLQRHHVENNKIVLDQTLTYASMGATDTLKSFIKYGLTTYPAQKTALVLWNHGGGIQGACFDERKSGDGVTPSELVSAVSGALSDLGCSNEKLEVIGYDCCLMQVQDIANVNAPYFNYMVASQESESGTGWDYDTWVDDLYAGKSTNDILKAIADGFIIDNGKTSSNNQTLSYLNLKYAEEYRVAWEDMAGQLKNIINDSNKSEFNTFVSKTKKYAGTSYEYYGLFDSKNFITRLESNTKFKPEGRYLTAVKNAHKKLVEYSAIGKGAGKSHGLSMFWNISVLRSGWWSTDTTYSYNDYSEYFGFSNWDYLNRTYGAN